MGVSFLLSLKFHHFPKHARFLLWKNTRDKHIFKKGNIYFCSGSSCGRLLYCFWACGKVEHCEKGGKGTGVCACKCACVHTCACVYMCVHVYVCVCMCVSVSMCVFIYMCVCICEYLYV